jgi:hypothetical protein
MVPRCPLPRSLIVKPGKIQRRAVKSGIKASRKRGHILSVEELLDLRIQIIPFGIRSVLVLIGIASIVAALLEWPSTSNAIQGVEAVSGILAICFGAFGVRRTLSELLSNLNPLDFAEVVVELIAHALSGIDL